MTEANTNININVDEIEKNESSENEVKESQAKPNIRRGNEIKDWVKSIIIAAFIAVLLMQLIVPTVVREHSMEPSFYGGDYLIVGKISYKLTDPNRNFSNLDFGHDCPGSWLVSDKSRCRSLLIISFTWKKSNTIRTLFL